MRSETGKMPKVNGMRFSRILTTRLSKKQSGAFVGSDLDRFVPRGSPADSQLVCPVTFHCSVVLDVIRVYDGGGVAPGSVLLLRPSCDGSCERILARLLKTWLGTCFSGGGVDQIANRGECLKGPRERQIFGAAISSNSRPRQH